MRGAAVRGKDDMTSKAIVEQIMEGTAVVSVRRQSACGENCASCKARCSPGQVVSVQAGNELGAKKGDAVLVESSSGRLLFAAVLVYLVPVVLFIVGMTVAFYADVDGTPAALIAIAFFMLGIAFAVIYNRKVSGKKEIRHKIIEILK